MTNDSLPAGRVVIVVGAAGDLGRATALKLANHGMTVVAVDRDEAGLEGLPDGMAREVVDATDPNAAVPMVERAVHDVGPPDVLVNTIGAFQPADALATTPDLLRLMIDVNVGPALWLSQAVAPHMQRGRSVAPDLGPAPARGAARPRALPPPQGRPGAGAAHRRQADLRPPGVVG
jgi:NAD(P)-dependent dehydrogenase (short-subunit alcohol dehydrogenase family)